MGRIREAQSLHLRRIAHARSLQTGAPKISGHANKQVRYARWVFCLYMRDTGLSALLHVSMPIVQREHRHNRRTSTTRQAVPQQGKEGRRETEIETHTHTHRVTHSHTHTHTHTRTHTHTHTHTHTRQCGCWRRPPGTPLWSRL